MTRTTREIAHDFANAITVIRGSALLAKRRLGGGDHPAVADLDRVIGAADQAIALTDELREFAGDDEEPGERTSP